MAACQGGAYERNARDYTLAYGGLNMLDAKFIITVVQEDDQKEYEAFFKRNNIKLLYSCPCDGMGKDRTYTTWGLERMEYFCNFLLTTSSNAEQVMDLLFREMRIDAPSKGLALMLGVNDLVGVKVGTIENKEEKKMEGNLIIAIIANGTTKLLMDVAREAGAKGGTVIHAKGTLTENAAKFLSMEIAEEKELVFIVTKDNQSKENILKAIGEKAGKDTPIKAFAFTLPVEKLVGLASL